MDDHLNNLISGVRLFADVDRKALYDRLKYCRVVAYSPDEYILRNGEYDENCCVLLAGKARVDIPGESRDPGEEKFMIAGDVFGEISAMSGVPRTADIVAVESCEIMEIPKDTMFHLLDDFTQVKTRMDEIYKNRILGDHLRKNPIFSGLPESILDRIKEKSQLQVCRKGEVVFEQNDEADAFYLVLFGMVKISRTRRSRIEVLAYLSGEQYFGEFALLSDGEKRTATVTAIGRTQLIRIDRTDFLELLDEFPSTKKDFLEAGKKRREAGKKLAGDTLLSDTLRATVDTGLFQSNTAHLLDTTKCIQCDICVESCAALHDGVSRLARKGVRLNGFLMAATSCRHCKDPACMYQCPTGAITRDVNGEIYHKSNCVGCGSCARNCPYDNITMVDEKPVVTEGVFRRTIFAIPRMISRRWGDTENEKRVDDDSGRIRKSGKKVVKCDMCRDYEIFGCVYNCPTGAMIMVDPGEYFSELLPVD